MTTVIVITILLIILVGLRVILEIEPTKHEYRTKVVVHRVPIFPSYEIERAVNDACGRLESTGKRIRDIKYINDCVMIVYRELKRKEGK